MASKEYPYTADLVSLTVLSKGSHNEAIVGDVTTRNKSCLERGDEVVHGLTKADSKNFGKEFGVGVD